MDWATKVKYMRRAIAQSVTFTGPGANALHEYFMDQMYETDHFHPFNTDRAMSPDTMVPEMVYEMFEEVADLIRPNFGPEMTFNADATADRFLKMVDGDLS